MPTLGWPELLLIAVVLVMLFGAKKLPDTARALGRSMRIFKSETKAMQADDDGAPTAQQATSQATSQATPQRAADKPGELPASAQATDGATINGRPLTESERTPKSST